MSFRYVARARIPVRLLASIATCVLVANVRVALAQTVMVQSAPAGSTIELTMNNGDVVSAKADALGDATLALPGRTNEGDVQIHVDACGSSVRVLIVSQGQQPAPPQPGCNRKDLWGIYVMRPTTTFMVVMNGNDSSVFISQGPPPPSWLRGGAAATGRVQWGAPSTGFALSAGAGFLSFSQFVTSACGNVTPCESVSYPLAVSLGAEYWITRLIAAQVGFVRPGELTASGGGDNFRFDSRLQSRVVTVGGKVGVGVGPARLYAMGGLNHHEATSTTIQTNDDTTVTVNGVTQTIKGGTQAFAQKTAGWNWHLGGGAEVWFTRWGAIYGEFSRAKIKGTPTGGGEGGLDEQATLIFGGIRLRLPR